MLTNRVLVIVAIGIAKTDLHWLLESDCSSQVLNFLRPCNEIAWNLV